MRPVLPIIALLALAAVAVADAQVTSGPARTDTANTWTGQQTWSVGYPATKYPVISGVHADGVVSPRVQTMLQIVGSADPRSGTSEVNVVDAFAYNGIAQYSAERYNRGTSKTGAVRVGEGIGVYSFEPFDGGSDSNTAQMRADATEDHDHAAGRHGTSLTFSYTPNGSGSALRYTGLTISRGGLGGVTVGDKGHQSPPSDLGAGTLHVASSIVAGGHLSSDGAAPTASRCGAGSAVTGTDNAGTVHVGGAASCTIAFHQAWAKEPVCIVQTKGRPAPAAYVSAVSTTQLVIALGGSLTGGVNYICQGVGGV